METMIKGVALGMKRAKGEFEGDDGKPFKYDYTRIYVEMPFGKKDDNGRGSSVVTYTIGDSTSFEKFKDMTFPMQVELTLERYTDGSKQKESVTDFKVVNQAPRKVA